jgi:NAD(P)-dependent dehydrogenase (short-subunit alcohol dehydrogenase family)
MRLKDKVVVVTGAARGLAAKASRLMSSEGATIVAADRDIKRLREVVDSIEKSGAKAIAVEVDVTSRKMFQAMADAAVTKYGRIDVIVNAAGGYYHYNGMIETSEDEWQSVIDSNLKSVFLGCQAVLPHMVRQQYGRIVNISSLAARTYSYFLGAHYSAAKAGVLGLTRHIAYEYGPQGICANAVLPTAFRGERLSEIMSPEQEKDLISKIPLRRLPEADDIVPVIAFLASDDARFISGASIDVNGAMVTA